MTPESRPQRDRLQPAFRLLLATKTSGRFQYKRRIKRCGISQGGRRAHALDLKRRYNSVALQPQHVNEVFLLRVLALIMSERRRFCDGSAHCD